MNPIAYTFDWGLTTDVSRINAAKVCGKLGVEHIIRSADIEKKRICKKKPFFLVKKTSFRHVTNHTSVIKDFMIMEENYLNN